MRRAAVIVGILLIVFGLFTPVTTTLVTFLLPGMFGSSAIVSMPTNTVASFPAAVAAITSPSTLDQVVTNLNLGAEWGRNYKQPTPLSTARCSSLLKSMVRISQPRRTTLIEIQVFSDNKDEAATIANKFAALFVTATPGASIVENATPGATPARPNKKLNIVLGLAIGSLIAGLGIALLVFARRKPATLT